MGLQVSPRLGNNFSGNGDVCPYIDISTVALLTALKILAFAYNTDSEANAIGMPGNVEPSKFSPGPVGPCITGVIDMRDDRVAQNVLDGYVIEEGVVPHALSHILGKILAFTPGKIVPNLEISGLLTHAARQAESKVMGPYTGALNHTQTYVRTPRFVSTFNITTTLRIAHYVSR